MKKKWSLRSLGIVFWSIVLIAAAGYLGYSSFKTEKEVVEARTPTIALVNEDVSADFNGKKYNFGKEFVNQVSSDNKYEWQVVSRSVATTAFEKGTVDAVIYLPQSFSQDILTFQNINPVKANVEYKVQEKSDRLATLVLQDEIVAALHTLNSDVVEMYYASVANSLAEAEFQMNASLQNQELFVTTLTNQVKTPFENMSPQYDSLISSTSTLNSLNQSTITAQNSFVTSTTNILKQTNSGLNGQLPLVEQYIKNYNAASSQNFKNAQTAIAKQEDLDFQKFDNLSTNILSQLALFYQEQPTTATVGQTDPALNALEKKLQNIKESCLKHSLY
ncbi:TPA: type VII secretion protein EsaA [Streptococcus suis]